MARQRLYKLLILGSCCIVVEVGYSTQPTWPAYDRFKATFARNEPDSLLLLASDLAHATDQRNRCLGMLATAGALFRQDDWNGCDSALDSLERYVPVGDALLRSVGLRIRSMLMTLVGNPELGKTFAESGLALLNGSDAVEERVPLMVVRAEALVELNDLEGALEQYLVAQRESEAAHFIRGECLVRIGVGNIRYRQKRYDEAMLDYATTFELASAHSFSKVAQSALGNMAGVAAMTGEYERALVLYDSLLDILGRRSPEFRARLIGQKGYVYNEIGDHAQAVRMCTTAIALADSIGDHRAKADALQDLAYAWWYQGRHSHALDLLQEALTLVKELRWTERVRDIHWDLYVWNQELGDEGTALRSLISYSDLSDSIENSRFRDQLARSEVLFETERKEHTIKEQKQALLLAEVQDRKKSFQRNVSIGVAALLLLIAALLYRSMRTRKRLAQKEKELHGEQVDQLLSQQEIKSINAMLEGQEKERDRVGKDLHDRLGSMLGGIKAQLGALEDRVEQVQHDAQFKKVHRLLDETVGELRQISHDMAASTLSRFGLEKALNDLRDTIHISGRLSVEMKAFGLEQRLERSVEIAVYRIIQELVSNVLKHAKASELSIGVTRSPGRLSVIVSDNGLGFDTAKPAEGMGLGNVRSRAAALGGNVQVDSSTGKGTTVSMECPVVE